MPHFWLKRAKIAGSAGCSSILSVSERGCQCERRQQTCKRVAKHYTIGLHKNPPSLPRSQLPVSLCILLLFCRASFVMVFISVKNTKTCSCLKEESFTIIYINKKLYFNITITSDNSIYLPCSFCATNEQRYTRFYCSGLNVP